MWDNTSFDNNAGGFLNSSQDVSGAKTKKDQARRVQSVVPLVARQINECEDENFQLFGTPVQIANVVGVLRNFDVQSTKISCLIEDHTGSVRAILWLENNNETITELPQVKEGCYVQVYGLLRHQEDGKIIMILKMFPVDDCNLITNHLLQVIQARLTAEANSKSTTLGVSFANNTTLGLSDVNMATTNTMQNNIGLTKLQEKIFQLLQSGGDNAIGLERKAIMQNFSAGQAGEVNAALEFLLNEGHVYSTIDNDHFKATDSI